MFFWKRNRIEDIETNRAMDDLKVLEEFIRAKNYPKVVEVPKHSYPALAQAVEKMNNRNYLLCDGCLIVYVDGMRVQITVRLTGGRPEKAEFNWFLLGF